MGFFSGFKSMATLGLDKVAKGLLGGGGGGGGGADGSAGIPKWVSQAGMENYDFAKEIANRPFAQFQGDRVAALTPQQQQAISQFGGLASQGQGLAQRGFDVLSGLGTADQRLSAYYNPYEQQVLDRSMNDLERQRQMALQQTAGQSLANRAFGGSRQAVRESLTNEAFAKQAADTAANLRYQGFNTALGAAQADLAQQQGLAQALGQAGYGAMQAGLDVGSLQQQQNQALIDAEREKFTEERNYPLEQLAIKQSALGQTPYNVNPYIPKPDKFSQIMQLGGLALGGAALLSDENAKKGIKSIKGTNILNKLENMPVKEWEYKESTGMEGGKHIGPMAQDFAAAFGGDGKSIDIATALGTNLVGIQQLAKRVKKLEQGK